MSQAASHHQSGLKHFFLAFSLYNYMPWCKPKVGILMLYLLKLLFADPRAIRLLLPSGPFFGQGRIQLPLGLCFFSKLSSFLQPSCGVSAAYPSRIPSKVLTPLLNARVQAVSGIAVVALCCCSGNANVSHRSALV